MKKSIILIGGGGHCKSCIDVIESTGDFQIEGIVDIPEKLHEKVLGYEIIASDHDLLLLAKEYPNFLITIGQIRSPQKRTELFENLKSSGGSFPVVISPFAYVSSHASVDEGSIVMHHALVNAGAQIGKNCIINTKALIEHDVIIGDHCHISTNATINGGVNVETGSFLGSNSVSVQSVTIGMHSFIGCSVKILTDIQPKSYIKE